MRLLTVFAFISFLFGCAVTKSVNQQDDIVGINYIVKIPMVIGDRQLFNFGDTTSIYYYKDLVVYQLPYTFDSLNTIYHIQSDSIFDEYRWTETRYNYFVYRQGSQTGIWYRSIELLHSNKRLSVDSILSIKATPVKIQSIIDNPNESLVENSSLENGAVFIEKYISKTKPDESYNDTTLLKYSRVMKSIRFSLSPYLDSMKDAKLTELRFQYNEAYSQNYSITMPKRDIVYKIEQIKSVDSERLKKLLERFKQDGKDIL